MGLEIERKFLYDKESFPYDFAALARHEIAQGYLTVNPVVRIRKEDDTYYMTYKNGSGIAKEEYNLPLTEEAYLQLLPKCEGRLLSKTRYLIPYLTYTIELDVFHGDYEGLTYFEVEFPNIREAEAFTPPFWAREEVSCDRRYHNSALALENPEF